jgi:alkaline phosphatase isozyme conversion protein
MFYMRRELVFVLGSVLALSLSSVAIAGRPDLSKEVGSKAYSYIEELAIASRVADTPEEFAAALKVEAFFRAAGYPTELQPFTYASQGYESSSQNVIAYRAATKKPKARPTPLVIVGAHYDSVPFSSGIGGGLGADDNASGVGVMLEVAERIARYNREYDIIFVAFGAEEVGLKGSNHFVERMSESDIARTIVMICFDSLIVGDKLYIHAGANEKTWARDEMLRLIRLRKLPIEMQPGLNPDYPAGFTPDGFSDYTAFNRAGIPIVAFESTNWEIGDLDGYVQTELYGSFWHNHDQIDTLEWIEQLFPGRPMIRLNAYTTLVSEFLKHLNPNRPVDYGQRHPVHRRGEKGAQRGGH